MTLMEFSIVPLDKGISLSRYVARAMTIIDESGLDYRVNPMGTVVEGEWDQLLSLLTKCFRNMEEVSERINLQVKFDYRKGVSGAIDGKVRSVQEKAGRRLKI